MKICTKAVLNLALLILTALSAGAQGTAFNYQGRLNDGGQPATGLYDVTFSLYDAGSGGTMQGNILTNTATPVTNGLFSVTLDFGNQFPGAARWLELGVRTNGGGAFGTLTPRQQLLPTPYAIFSGNAGTAGTVSGSVPVAQVTGTVPLTQLPSAVVTNGASGVNVTGTFTGNGGGVTNLFATNLVGTLADARLSTNVALLSGTNVFAATNRFAGVVIATNVNNQISGAFTGNGAGITNLNSTNLTANIADARLSANVALRAGGNTFSGGQTFDSGAINIFGNGLNGNTFQKFVLYADTGNGMLFEAPLDANNNKLPYKFSWRASAPAMVIQTNGNVGIGTTTPGDAELDVTRSYGHVTINKDVWAQFGNGGMVTVGGPNSEQGFWGIAGNNESALFSLGQLRLAGGSIGFYPNASLGDAFASARPVAVMTVTNTGVDIRRTDGNGPVDNITFGSATYHMGALGEGGPGNDVYLANIYNYAPVANAGIDFRFGGNDPSLSAMRVTTSGVTIRRADAAGDGDSLTFGSANYHMGGLGEDASHNAVYLANIHGADSGNSIDFRFGGAKTTMAKVTGDGEITCVAVNITSDRNAKEDFMSVSPRDVLDKVARLPISEWQYKNEKPADSAAVRHIGPMAQDFSAAFALGHDEKHISLVDEGGVALAAIQGLNEKLEEAHRENEELKKSVEALQAQVQKLISTSAKQ